MTAIVVLVALTGGIYDLMRTDPYKVGVGVERLMTALEERREEGDAVYVGGFAAPVVQFYDRSEPDYYFYGKCVGKYFNERCAADIRDTIRFILYSRSAKDAPPGRLFLLFHNDVPSQAITQAIAEFYAGEAELASVSGSQLYVLNNFPHIAAEISAQEAFVQYGSDMGDMVINGLFRVFLRGNELTYLKRPCGPNNVYTAFYLHLLPVDEDELPIERREDGFDKLNFDFDRNAFRDDGSCAITVQLPEYDVSRIRTGQYVSLKSLNIRFLSTWESDWRDVGYSTDSETE